MLISNLFHLKIEFYCEKNCALTLITCPRLKQAKMKMIVFQTICFSIDYGRSFIHSSLDIVCGFRLDESENRLWYTHMQLCFTLFIQKWDDIYHECHLP